MSNPSIKEEVREKYGQVARRVASGASNSCCGDRPRWKRLVIR